MSSVYIKTLGCKVNTYDSNALATQFEALGYSLADQASEAAITVLNTCSVTANATKEARYYLRRFRRDNPNALIVATGCYAQTDSKKLLDMTEVDMVIPNEVKQSLVGSTHKAFQNLKNGTPITERFPADLKPVENNRQAHFKSSLELMQADSTQTRSFLKIQDGCNGFCSYCLIPYARGASRSVKPTEIKKEVRRLIESGVKELVLTGIHIGDFGEEHNYSLSRLIRELWEWDDMIRIRISSLEPRELTEDLLEALNERPELVCDHFHLPLQSGSDRVLKLMRRTYDTQMYAEKLAMARSYFPEAMIGADVIPGFPSESEEDFTDTVQFINSCNMHYLHVFPYSKRPNTAAARMPMHLDEETVKLRSRSLRELSTRLKRQYERSFINRPVEVLWEKSQDRSGRPIGHSRNYLEIVGPSTAECQPGMKEMVRIKGFTEDHRLFAIPLRAQKSE